MMNINRSDVDELVRLSVLSPDQDRRNQLVEQFQDILGHVRKLEELDLEDVEPLTHPLDLTGGLREDEIVEPVKRERALQNAPEREGPYVRIARLFGSDA